MPVRKGDVGPTDSERVRAPPATRRRKGSGWCWWWKAAAAAAPREEDDGETSMLYLCLFIPEDSEFQSFRLSEDS
uniref:Uncharacterized protein n=1 Tax=Leersia perrieri TaxID=77586 RepID=A0A0D9WLJ3_9ORYZ